MLQKSHAHNSNTDDTDDTTPSVVNGDATALTASCLDKDSTIGQNGNDDGDRLLSSPMSSPMPPLPALAVADNEPHLLRCVQCNGVAYCSAACQRAHWQAHACVCVDPTARIGTARSAALFLGTSREGPSVLELMAYGGWGPDIATCLNLCQHTRNDENLWALVDVPHGAKLRTRLMYWAGRGGDLARVRDICRYIRIDALRGDALGRTALHWASIYGHLDIVRELLDRGVPVGVRNSGGGTPLHDAGANNCAVLVRELVARGADIEARTAQGSTPLICASHEGQAASVAALLVCGADVNAQAHSGMTPLMMAAFKNHVDVACVLLTAPRLNFDLVDASGKTALSIAEDNGHTIISAKICSIMMRGPERRRMSTP